MQVNLQKLDSSKFLQLIYTNLQAKIQGKPENYQKIEMKVKKANPYILTDNSDIDFLTELSVSDN